MYTPLSIFTSIESSSTLLETEENYYLRNFCFNHDTIFSRFKINKLLHIPTKASRLLYCCILVLSRHSQASLDLNSVSCSNSVYFT